MIKNMFMKIDIRKTELFNSLNFYHKHFLSFSVASYFFSKVLLTVFVQV